MHLRTLAACSTLGFLLGAAPVSHAVEPHVLRDLAIPSPTLGQPIPCAVTLPDDYDRDPTRRFPVFCCSTAPTAPRTIGSTLAGSSTAATAASPRAACPSSSSHPARATAGTWT